MNLRKTKILILFGITIVVIIAYREKELLLELLSHLHIGWSIISLTALALANFSMSITFGLVTTIQSSRNVSALVFAATYLSAQASKYLPGKVWPIAVQMLYLHGKAEKKAIVIGNLETALLSMMVITATGAGLLWFANSAKELGFFLMIMGVIFAWLLGRSLLLNSILRQVVLRTRRIEVAPQSAPSLFSTVSKALFAAISSFFLFYLIGWCSFVGLALSHDLDSTIRLVGLMSISYVAGVLSLFPAGIGTRELSMVALASIFGIDANLAASVAVISRLMFLAIDLTAIALGAYIFGLISTMGAKEQ